MQNERNGSNLAEESKYTLNIIFETSVSIIALTQWEERGLRVVDI
jgi:hypothetical protein